MGLLLMVQGGRVWRAMAGWMGERCRATLAVLRYAVPCIAASGVVFAGVMIWAVLCAACLSICHMPCTSPVRPYD